MIKVPSLVPTGKPVLVGCSEKNFLPPLVPTEKAILVMLFLKDIHFYLPLHLFPPRTPFWSGSFERKINPSTCSDWETCFFRVFYKKLLRENKKATHRLGTWLKLPDRQKSDLLSEIHQIRLKIGENSAIISLSFYKL